jgi:hypothetical protein
VNSITRSYSENFYTITYQNQTCRVSGDLYGIALIGHVLTADGLPEYVWISGRKAVHREVCVVDLVDSGVAPSSRQRLTERGALLTPAKLKKHIASLERDARIALNRGDSSTYDCLMVEVRGLRAHQRSTRSCGSHDRVFADEVSRASDAVRKAIERGIAAIRKASPAIADHFKATILHWGRGTWFYAGNREEWTYETDLSGLPYDEMDPDFIREQWLASRPTRPIWWDATPQETKIWILSRLLDGSGKSFGIRRPAYKGGGGESGATRQFEDEVTGRDLRGEIETREGDDRDSEDFERGGK